MISESGITSQNGNMIKHIAFSVSESSKITRFKNEHKRPRDVRHCEDYADSLDFRSFIFHLLLEKRVDVEDEPPRSRWETYRDANND